eukprot:2398258-Rhodomonas_salina.1
MPGTDTATAGISLRVCMPFAILTSRMGAEKGPRVRAGGRSWARGEGWALCRAGKRPSYTLTNTCLSSFDRARTLTRYSHWIQAMLPSVCYPMCGTVTVSDILYAVLRQYALASAVLTSVLRCHVRC